MSVQSEIDRINGEVNSQSTIIDQISSVLDSKSPSNMLSSGEIVTNSVSTPLQNNTTKLQALKEKADSLPEYVPPAKLQEKTVTPTKEGLSVVPDGGFDGMSKVTVNGDNNLVPENIKEGVSIFGINGSNAGEVINSIELDTTNLSRVNNYFSCYKNDGSSINRNDVVGIETIEDVNVQRTMRMQITTSSRNIFFYLKIENGKINLSFDYTTDF